MTIEEFEILTHDKIQALIEENLFENSANLALRLKKNDFPTYIVSQQLKYLQKSRKKIPSFYKARCIIPALAFEQASSEQSASLKSYQGKRCLDLTAGLGVDSAHFAQNFEKVDAVELDEVKLAVARYNFERLGIENVSFHQDSAENYANSFMGEKYDLIYLDPARRDQQGKRTFAPEDCQPNIFDLLAALFKIGKKIVVKLSPLYDHVEAFRRFPDLSHFHIVSINNEVKEVLLELSQESDKAKEIIIKTCRGEDLKTFTFARSDHEASIMEQTHFSFIWDPDVAFYKARLFPQLLRTHFPNQEGYMEKEWSFMFSNVGAPADFPGRCFKISKAFSFKPKMLKKELKKLKISRAEIIQRNFPLSVSDIRKKIGLDAGGDHYLWATSLKGEKKIFLCKKVF